MCIFLQVISDSAIINIIKSLQHLQFLALSYCFGGISSLSFKTRIPNLRSLKLERVTPWMTNEELAILAENCADLVKLSLVGCPLLDFSKCVFSEIFKFTDTLSVPTASFLFPYFYIRFHCRKLNERSFLSVEAQAIISNGWPGLTSLHLEVGRCPFLS